MRVRRRTSGFRVADLFSWVRPGEWLARLTARLGSEARPDDWLQRAGGAVADDPAIDPGTETPAYEPIVPVASAVRAPEPGAGPPPRNESEPDGERWTEKVRRVYRRAPVVWILVGTFGLTWMIGYAIAAFILFPAPFFTSDRSVPDLIGLHETDAVTQLTEQGLTAADLEYEQHASAERGHVIWQDPPPGVVVPEITPIQLVISNGPPRIPVPDVAGFEMALATSLLESAGLTVGRVENVQTAVPRNVTVNTRPAPGATLLPGGAVTLVVSVGAPTVQIPDLIGLTRDEARDTLEAVGLSLGSFEWRTSSAQPHEHILEQRPAANTLAAAGTAVTVFLARRPS